MNAPTHANVFNDFNARKNEGVYDATAHVARADVSNVTAPTDVSINGGFSAAIALYESFITMYIQHVYIKKHTYIYMINTHDEQIYTYKYASSYAAYRQL